MVRCRKLNVSQQTFCQRQRKYQGVEVSLGSLLENTLVENQLGYRLLEPIILPFSVFQALRLIECQPSRLAPTPMITGSSIPVLLKPTQLGFFLHGFW